MYIYSYLQKWFLLLSFSLIEILLCFVVNLCNFQLSPSMKANELYKAEEAEEAEECVKNFSKVL